MPSKIVGHIKEISDGGARYDEDNLQALCSACHNRKSAEEKNNRTNNKICIVFFVGTGTRAQLAATAEEVSAVVWPEP